MGQRLAIANTNHRGSWGAFIDSAAQDHGHHHPANHEIHNADEGAPASLAAEIKRVGDFSHGRTVWRSSPPDDQSCGNGHSCLLPAPLDQNSIDERSVSSLISVVILVGVIRLLNARFSSARLG